MSKKLNDSRILALLMVMLMLVTVQCSSFVKTTYSSLGTAGVVYDAGMKTVADLYKQEIMSEEDKDLAISIAQDYHDVYLSAVAALEIYQGMAEGDKDGQKMQIIEMMEKLTEIGSNLTAIIQKYTASDATSLQYLINQDTIALQHLINQDTIALQHLIDQDTIALSGWVD